MKKFVEKLEAADIIAIVLVIGVVGSNWLAVARDFMVPQSLLLIIGYYFGRRIQKNGWH